MLKFGKLKINDFLKWKKNILNSFGVSQGKRKTPKEMKSKQEKGYKKKPITARSVSVNPKLAKNLNPLYKYKPSRNTSTSRSKSVKREHMKMKANIIPKWL